MLLNVRHAQHTHALGELAVTEEMQDVRTEPLDRIGHHAIVPAVDVVDRHRETLVLAPFLADAVGEILLAGEYVNMERKPARGRRVALRGSQQRLTLRAVSHSGGRKD